jgi:TolA-binding protein
MKRLTYFLVLIFISSHSLLFSQSHTPEFVIENELDRLKGDIIDLQKFVYKNSNSSTNQTNESSELENLNQLLGSIADKLSSLEIQINDMKDDISNLYLLYTSPQFDTNNLVNSTKELNIDESSSKIVSEKNNDNQSLGQLSLTELDSSSEEKLTAIVLDQEEENEEINPSQSLGELSISTLAEQVIELQEPTEEDLSTLKELDQLMQDKEKELNKPIIDILLQLQLAKQGLANLENQKAIDSLLLIIGSETKNLDILAEAYYLIGRTYFIEGQMMESVKYFGLRHRDLSDISKFRSESYIWLGKSLFSIGDQENGCLIMEDIIFSNSYLDKDTIIEEAKTLQDDKDCGLIID